MTAAPKNRNAVLALLVATVALVGVVALLARSKLSLPEKKEERPRLAVAQEPPKPPAAEAPPPPVEPSLADTEAAKNALLGLDRQEKKGVDVTRRPDPPATRRVRAAQSGDPQPEVIEEEPEIGLSDNRFHDAVERWRGVQTCIATRTKKGPEQPSGSLRVSFQIAPSGEVTKAKAFEESNDDARELAPCVEKQAKQIRFPSFTGEPFAAKEAKFVF